MMDTDSLDKAHRLRVVVRHFRFFLWHFSCRSECFVVRVFLTFARLLVRVICLMLKTFQLPAVRIVARSETVSSAGSDGGAVGTVSKIWVDLGYHLG